MSREQIVRCDRCGKVDQDCKPFRMVYIEDMDSDMQLGDAESWVTILEYDDCCPSCRAHAVKHVERFTNRFKKKPGAANRESAHPQAVAGNAGAGP